ncbi:unnamed protein product [Polarella glacialis]|nr:unnamed protein product [Polarella glacialis]
MAHSLRDRLGVDVATERLGAIGFTTGIRLATRMTAVKLPITNERNLMKYVCKELWTYLFRKPANRLQTDRLGRYIIQDWSFRWLEQFQPPAASGGVALAGANGSPQTTLAGRALAVELQELACLHLALPCGLLRGALHALGLESKVSAEVSVQGLPQCTFIVTLEGSEQAAVAAAAAGAGATPGVTSNVNIEADMAVLGTNRSL